MKKKGLSKLPGPPSQTLNRKEKRKAERKLKKKRRDAYAHRNFDIMENLKDIDHDYNTQKEAMEKVQKAKAKRKKYRQQRKNKLEAKKKESALAEQEFEDEELELHDLEKRLKLHKKKTGSKLPKAFVEDGLDYLLDATESDKIKEFDDIAQDFGALEDSESEDDDLGEEEMEDENSAPAFSWDPDSKAGKSILKKVKKTSKKSVQFTDDKDDDDLSDQDFLGMEDDEEDDNDEDEDILRGEDENEDISGSDNDDEEDDEDEDILRGEDENEDISGSDNDDEEDDDKVEDEDSLRKLQVSAVKRKKAKTSKEDDLPEEENPSKKRKITEDVEESGKEELKEDIYGRLRDKDGNVVKSSSAYIPPAKRAMMAGSQTNAKLQKNLKGLVNRVSEGTMQALSNQIESLYLEHSRADVNETLCGLIMEAVISPVLSPERLVAELAMLVAILHSNVGSEVGAFFLQKLAVKFKELDDIPEYGIGKSMENVLMLMANFYNFKIVSSSLIVDVMQKLINKFEVRDIELLLLLFKNVGFTLRKDDPVQLKQVILDVQAKARESISSVEGMESRIKFMLDILTAIRNNNMRKIPGYDPKHLEHLRKLVKSFLRGQVLGDNMLTIGLEDLWKADQFGRWWIVGSAWEGRKSNEENGNAANEEMETERQEESSMSKKMLKLAKLQGMNTDVRRQIFCILGTSEDFEDAFARLIRMKLSRTQEREILHVLFHCCLNEKVFNPFYAFLAEKLCTFDRRFVITVQFTMWDKFKEVDSMSKETRIKLGQFLSHLILSKALSLSVLKVVEFGMESKKMIRLLVQVLSEILSSPNMSTVMEIFERIAPIAKLKPLCQGLQVFMRVHLKGATVKTLSSITLHERIEKVEAAMFSRQSMLL